MTTNRVKGMMRLAAALAVGSMTFLTVPAWGQSRGGRGGGAGSRGSVGRTLLHRQTGNTTGLSGVKAKLPRPIRSLGGVKAQLPRPLANRGSLLPPSKFHGHSGRPVREVSGPRFDSDFHRFRDSRSGRGRGGDRGGDRFRVGFDSGLGFRASGSFGDADDNFRLRFRLNPGGVFPGDHRFNDFDRRFDRFKHRHHRHDHFPLGTVWPYGWYDWYDDYDDYPPQTIVSSPIYIDPSMFGVQPQQQQPPQAPAAPPTALELADFALYEGRVDDAIGGYREHLAQYAEDADAMRRLAVALIQDRQVKEGVALLALAYEKDLSLVRKPLDPQMVWGGAEAFRGVLRAVVPFANRMRTSSGYLAVAAIMQGEGRDDLALKMIEKAKLHGLEERLAAEFEAELRQ